MQEDLKITAADTAACYLRLGPQAADLMRGSIKVELPFQGKNKGPSLVKVGSEPGNSREKLEADCAAELKALAKTIGLNVSNSFFFAFYSN